jgi:hypothetical protein
MAKIYPISTHKPQGSDSPRMGDDVIRALARAVIEWLGTDHFIEADFSGTPTGKDYDDDDGGKHNQITFRLAMDATPSLGASDEGILYTKTVSGTPELHFRDAAGNEIQLTDNGGLSNILLKNNLPQINIQEADQSAPAGRWRIQSSDDVLTIQGRKDDDSDFVSILKLTRESHVEVGTATGGRRQVKNIADPTEDQDAATKAYVASVPSHSITAKDAATTYTAEASGVLVVQATITWIYNTETYVSVLSDDNATPTTVVGRIGGKCTRGDSQHNIQYLTCSVPIVKGKKYRVTTTASGAVVDSITWYPNE